MRVVPALNGIAWTRDGWRLFTRNPMNWLLAVFSYWLIMALIGALPYAGLLAATLCVPPFTVSFMNISRDCEQGRAFDPTQVFSGFRSQLAPLLRMGAVFFVALVLILMLTRYADGGMLMRMLLLAQMPDPQADAEAFRDALLLFCALVLPVMLAMWHAPVLAAWQQMGATKAMFFSFFACLRNWRALCLYGLLWALLGTILPAVLGALLGGGAEAAPGMFARALLLIYTVALLPTLLASLYCSYRDIFGGRPAESADR